MRSTRNRTRSTRRLQHYTEAAHLSVPAVSNSPASSRKGNSGRMNTNTRLRDGGISSYYRPREGRGQF